MREAPAGDLYHGMAFMGIPVALDLGKRDRKPVVYDARDIYLNARNLARMGRPARWFLGRLERGWAKRSSRVITVNEAYADVMSSRWPVQRPLVVMNCSFRFTPASPRERRFHEHLGLDQSEKVVLYHGGLFPWRGIEQLIEAIALVPDATLVLMGYGILEPTLKAWEADPATGGKVRVMGAVPPDQLHDWVAAADVAAMPIQGDTLNHRLTTPQKLFEAMAAGVPAVVSDLPGMSAIVNETGSGILVDPTDTRAIADAITRIVQLPEDEWLAWRQRCLDAAHERYNWETQVQAPPRRVRQAHGQAVVSDAAARPAASGDGRSSSSATRPTRTRGRSASGGRWPRTATTSRLRRRSPRARPNARRTARSSSAATGRAACSRGSPPRIAACRPHPALTSAPQPRLRLSRQRRAPWRDARCRERSRAACGTWHAGSDARRRASSGTSVDGRSCGSCGRTLSAAGGTPSSVSSSRPICTTPAVCWRSQPRSPPESGIGEPADDRASFTT